MVMQQMMMHRLLYGGYTTPMSYAPPPPPFYLPPTFTPPPPPPPPFSVPPPSTTPERPSTSSSMDVLVDDMRTASPSSSISFSTYFEPSPPTSPLPLAWDDVDQRSLSPSIFMHQNGQDMLWHLRMNVQDSDSSSVESDGVDVDDDVVFVREYRRPFDAIPAEGTAEYFSMRLLEVEQRARAAEERADAIERLLQQRIERSSCAVCTTDFLTINTLRMPCGHLSCERCLAKIARDAASVTDIKCPQCREVYYSVNNCSQIIFP